MLIFLVVIAIIAAATAPWILAAKSQTPRRRAITKTPHMPYEEVTIQSGDASLKGWFIPAAGNKDVKSPLIIIVHGWSSNKERMLRYVDRLYEAGYALLLFDVRGHGENDQAKIVTALTFREDILAAIQYAKSRDEVDPERIGMLTHSFGAFSSIVANKQQLGIKALVTDSMPTQFRTIMEASLSHYKLPYYPLGPILSKIMFIQGGISAEDLKDFDVPHALKQRVAPVLLVHSKNDHYVPASELTYLINSQDDRVEKAPYLFVDSEGHSNSVDDPKFWEHVLPFFEKHV